MYIVFLDVQMGGEMKSILRDVYQTFFKSIFTSCDLPEKAGSHPLNVVESIYNIELDPFVVFLTPGLTLS